MRQARSTVNLTHPVNQLDLDGRCLEDACVIEGTALIAGGIAFVAVGTAAYGAYVVSKALKQCGGVMLCAIRVGSAVIPLPRADSKTARKRRNDIYTVYEIRTNRGLGGVLHETWKYGITKNYPARPQAQLTKCERATGHKCGFISKKTTVGWFSARRAEAGYTAGYAMRHRRCPPGMPRCL